MDRKYISKLTSQILDCNDAPNIQVEYLEAIRSMDLEKLSYLETFGESVRHRLMNLDKYRRGLSFGFTEIKFNESGWLDNGDWKEVITIDAKVKKDKASFNSVEIACGLNGKWAYGLHYTYGAGAGGGWAPSVFDKAYDSSNACTVAGISDLIERFDKNIKHYTERPDSTNFKMDYMKQVLLVLNGLLQEYDVAINMVADCEDANFAKQGGQLRLF